MSITEKDFTIENITYRPVLIIGDDFSDSNRTSGNILTEAKKRGYRTLPEKLAERVDQSISREDIQKLDLACLVIIYKPRKRPPEAPEFRFKCRGKSGWSDSGVLWPKIGFESNNYGFLFLAPQDESKKLDTGDSFFHFMKDS